MKWRKYLVQRPTPDPDLEHRSQVFAKLLLKFGYGRGIADAVSNAGLSFLGGAPRNPDLSTGKPEYSTIRYAEKQYSYTTIVVTHRYCPRCGRFSEEKYSLELVNMNDEHVKVGHVRVCSHCDKEHWMFVSRMPGSVAMRQMRARSVP